MNVRPPPVGQVRFVDLRPSCSARDNAAVVGRALAHRRWKPLTSSEGSGALQAPRMQRAPNWALALVALLSFCAGAKASAHKERNFWGRVALSRGLEGLAPPTRSRGLPPFALRKKKPQAKRPKGRRFDAQVNLSYRTANLRHCLKFSILPSWGAAMLRPYRDAIDYAFVRVSFVCLRPLLTSATSVSILFVFLFQDDCELLQLFALLLFGAGLGFLGLLVQREFLGCFGLVSGTLVSQAQAIMRFA